MTREQTLVVLHRTLRVWSDGLARWGELRLSAERSESELRVLWWHPSLPPLDPVVLRAEEDGRVVCGDRVLLDATAALVWLAWEQASHVYDIGEMPDLGPLPDDDMEHPA